MIRFLLLSLALWSSCADAAVLTFIEAKPHDVDQCKAILTALHAEALEEVDRPEKFVVLDTTDYATDLPASLTNLLTAPPDRRTHQLFGPGGTSLPPGAPFYVIAHLDLGPPDQASGQAALLRYMNAARHAPGNLGLEAWQQTNRPNHFNLVSAWSTRAQLDDFAASAATRNYRATVAPLIGSLYDERLYRRIR